MLRQQCFVNRVDLRFVVVVWARETANVRIALDLARSMTFDDVTATLTAALVGSVASTACDDSLISDISY